MIAVEFAVLVVMNILCVHAAQQMAIHRHRPKRPWMWMSALVGPIMLPALFLLPQKKD
jgi:hypothetical protein